MACARKARAFKHGWRRGKTAIAPGFPCSITNGPLRTRPVAGEAMRRWLDDDKFDRAGRQKQRLRGIREAIRKMIVVSSRCMLEIKGLLTFLFAKCCANPLPAGRPRKTK